MNSNQRLILALLSCPRRELYGLELVAEAEGKLRRGTIYVHLSSLQDAELVTSRVDGDLFPRRLYRITERGLRALETPEPPPFWKRLFA